MSDALNPMEGTPLIPPSSTDHSLYETVVEGCRTVYDPEIPVNIYDLGLISVSYTHLTLPTIYSV